MTFNDAHIHLFRGGYVLGASGVEHDVDTVGYAQLRSRNDIDLALVIGYTDDDRHRTNNTDILALARQLTWARPLAYVAASTHMPGAAAGVEAALDAGFVGVSVYATDPAVTVAPLLRAALPVLAERRALLSLNITPACYADVLGALESMPQTTTLISHLGLVGAGARSTANLEAAVAALGIFAELPAVAVKASGLYALPAGAAADVLAAVGHWFGWRRVLWGSDYPVVLGHASIEDTLALPLPANLGSEELAGVRGANLRRLLAGVKG